MECNNVIDARCQTEILTAAGETLNLCSPCCLVKKMQELQSVGAGIKAAFVTDYNTGEAVNYNDAYYVKTPKRGLCCEPSIIAFRRIEPAKAFIEKNQGILVSYEILNKHLFKEKTPPEKSETGINNPDALQQFRTLEAFGAIMNSLKPELGSERWEVLLSKSEMLLQKAEDALRAPVPTSFQAEDKQKWLKENLENLKLKVKMFRNYCEVRDSQEIFNSFEQVTKQYNNVIKTINTEIE